MRPIRSRPLLSRPLAAAALAVVAAGCTSSTAPAVTPGAVAGRYGAVTANGRALPVTVDTSSGDFGVLLADTLVLDGRGGAVLADRVALDTVGNRPRVVLLRAGG